MRKRQVVITKAPNSYGRTARAIQIGSLTIYRNLEIMTLLG